MQKLWFLYIHDTVFGPYSTDEVRHRIDQGVPEQSFVWWKGHTEWIPLEQFEKELPHFLDSQNKTPSSVEMWFFRKNAQEYGPFEILELVDILRNQIDELEHISVKSNSNEQWIPSFKSLQITDLLGISRRLNDRAPLMGSVKLWVDSNVYTVARSTTISIAGIGIRNINLNLKIGQEVQLEIKSPDLTDLIRVQAIVRYMTLDKMYGLVFQSPSAEAQSIIVDYIKCFKTNFKVAS